VLDDCAKNDQVYLCGIIPKDLLKNTFGFDISTEPALCPYSKKSFEEYYTKG
jgi:hypothetical protein